MSLIIKLVFVSIAVCGVSSTNYLDYNGLSNVYGVAYAPHYNEYKPKDYKFEYGVSDPHTGDHKSQWEVKENGVVRGAYSLLEPDGTTRIVEYIADDDGFRAVVKKIGTSIHPTSPVIVHPAPLSHVTSLYDHSSGVYAGTKENYIAAYQPRPVLYHDDHGAENIVADGPLDDEVRIFFNNDGHDDLVLHGGIAKEHRPEFNYVAPNEYAHVAQAEVKTPQIISVAPKVYYEPQQQIVAQAPILGKVHAVHPQLIVPEEGIHQPQGNLYHQQQVQHQILHDAQQHQFVQDVPLQHQIVHEAPLQHQIVHEAPLQHQYANEAALQHQYVHQVPLEHRIVHKVPVHKQQVIHQEVIQGPAHQQQAAYEHYQPKVAYQNEGVYEQLAPIPYKTISAYAKQPHQDVGYEYHTNY